MLQSVSPTGSSINDDPRLSGPGKYDYNRPFPGTSGLVRPMDNSLTANPVFQSRTGYSELSPPHREQSTSFRGTKLHELSGSNMDDPHSIRLSPTTGQIMAATPSRLIGQITSPNLLDYDLLSDFFLTFRAFMTTGDLVTQLIARLQWAVNRSDDIGRIIRVRTFVALRHWILNYFVDDFVSDYDLRLQFCSLVNNLCNDLQSRGDGAGGDIKILGELKKCWRRTCALYWDVPDPLTIDALVANIMPGGRLGSRQSKNDNVEEQSMVVDAVVSKRRPEATLVVVGSGRLSPDKSVGQWFPVPQSAMYESGRAAAIPMDSGSVPTTCMSDQSTHFWSCSIPTSAWLRHKPREASGSGPRPMAATPSSGAMLPGRPDHSMRHHNRSGSFSDAVRDDRAPLPFPKIGSQDTTLLPVHTHPGSLIRGAVVQPFTPYVEMIAPRSPTDEESHFDFDSVEDLDVSSLDERSGATHPGVKKLMGTVRRALSANKSIVHLSNEQHMLDDNLRYARTDGAPRPSTTLSRVQSGVPNMELGGVRVKLRIDLLAAGIAESFKKAVRQNVEAQDTKVTDRNVLARSASTRILRFAPDLQSNLSQADVTRLNSDVSAENHSILAMNDTGKEAVPDLAQAISRHDDQRIVHDGRFQSGPILLGPRESSDRKSASIPLVSSGSIVQTSYGQDRELRGLASAAEQLSLRTQRADQDQNHLGLSQRSGTPDPLQYASFQSLMARQSPQNGLEATTAVSEGTASSTNDPFYFDRLPRQPLRRRPGGDLRAVDHVHDLGDGPRTPSVDSVNTSQARAMSIPLRTSSAKATLNMIKPAPSQSTSRAISMLDTHSSQPILRPSFELEVQKLAQLPDFEDDGGRESALLKLEGRDKNPKELASVVFSSIDAAQSRQPCEVEDPGHGIDRNEAQRQREEEAVGNTILASHTAPDKKNVPEEDMPVREAPLDPMPGAPIRSGFNQVSAAESEGSYSSIPLLERGVSQSAPKGRQSSTDWLEVSLPQSFAGSNALAHEDQNLPRGPKQRSHTELETNQASTRVGDMGPDGMDNRERLSGVSYTTTEFQPTHHENGSRNMRSFYDDGGASILRDIEITLRPLRHSSDQAPTQPVPQKYPNDMYERTQSKTGPPDRFENAGQVNASHPPSNSHSTLDLGLLKEQPLPSNPAATHLPFILSYDSLMIAQQFTIIEQDALSEVDWKELIDLRWKHSAPPVLDWVDYLESGKITSPDQSLRGGVDVCIARFNIIVKWALSEIVLTHDIIERAACIVKYVHIAQHARKLRNWATMYQITMALVSADCSRLKRTWSIVPEREHETMKILESLITPMRNFHNLRAEMESATADGSAGGADGGCIPFIGIYTHDLIYNSQKPHYVQKSGGATGGELLINFERHHTAAVIVKNLLRMLEASSKYNFQPVPEVLSRCLWMKALDDKEIFRRSHEIEP